MKNSVTGALSASGLRKNAVIIAFGLMLGAALWIATIPAASGREMSASEMLQSKLLPPRILANASSPELLKAVCGAVGTWRRSAAQIVREAISSRRAPARDIVATAFRCMREGKEGPLDCSLVGDIYNAARIADPEDAAVLLDQILEAAPDCRGALGRGDDPGEFNSNPPSNVNPPPGSIGGGASRGLCLVCHNGHEIRIPCDQVPKYLKNHPGDNAGPCRPTPTTNL